MSADERRGVRPSQVLHKSHKVKIPNKTVVTAVEIWIDGFKPHARVNKMKSASGEKPPPEPASLSKRMANDKGEPKGKKANIVNTRPVIAENNMNWALFVHP